MAEGNQGGLRFIHMDQLEEEKRISEEQWQRWRRGRWGRWWVEGGDGRLWGVWGKVGCLGDKMSEGVDGQRWDGVVMGESSGGSQANARWTEFWMAVGND
jgi:hypothetical protein